MRLLHDCVRDVMLFVEENLEYDNVLMTSFIQEHLSDYSIEDINYTCKKLSEAGYLKIDVDMLDTITVIKMTYDGHVFLDNIRDNNVWAETKSKISKIASVSLPIIQQVASQLICNKLGI